MSAIYGLIRFDGAPLDAAEVRPMEHAVADWGPDSRGSAVAGDAAMGQLVRFGTPESRHETGPIQNPDGTVVISAGRLDNRDELIDALGIAGARDRVTTTQLIAAAFLKWRGDTPRRLYGDWAFAAWDPERRQLFLARDQFGNTALYYHRNENTFAFASGRKALFALPHVPRRLNELRLAQHLVVWVADGAATFHEGIFRVPPGHALTATASGITDERYWQPEHIPNLRLPTDDAYVERFVDLFSDAVRARLRTTRPAVATLSSGLDSGAVTAFAARELRDRGQSLLALTSVPLFAEAASVMPRSIIDEWEAAKTVASLYPNIEHQPLRAAGITPLEAMERSLAIHDEPEYAAGNLHWITDMLEVSRNRGAGVLFTGQMGNGGVSWTGDQQRVPGLFRRGRLLAGIRALHEWKTIQQTSWARAVWRQLVHPMRAAARGLAFRRGFSANVLWGHRLINREFAERIHLAERIRASGYDPTFSRLVDPRSQRLRFLLPDISPIGALWDESGAAYGLKMVDPTTDVRLLEYCLAIPDEQYERGDRDRWLIRRALEGLVPASIQWNTRRGVQGADLPFRLRADAANVDAILREIADSPECRAYLDLPAMNERWEALRGTLHAGSHLQAAILSRSILIGMFLARGC